MIVNNIYYIIMEYISIKNCECNNNYTCLIHRPDYNYSFLGYSIKDIVSKENISYKEYLEILKNKS